MYFILSKVLLCLICPLTWVCLLLLLALFAKSKALKRRSLIASIVILFVFSNTGLGTAVMRAWDVNQFPPDGEKFSTAIVLGGFSGEDTRHRGRFNWAADRFIQGLRLYETHTVNYVLITSGNGNLMPSGFREATWVREQMRQMNVPDTALFAESASRNTMENAKFSLAILQKNHIKGPYLLVTSAFHMRRALMIFKKQKIDVVPYSCNFTEVGNLTPGDWIIPSADTLLAWNLYIKEMVGYVVNSFTA